jgi:hypothetical protein
MVVCTYVQVALSTGAKKFSLGKISSLSTGEPILDSCRQQSGDGFAASGKIDDEHNHVLEALRITFALLLPFRPALHVETWLEAQRSCRFDRILGHVGFSIIGQPFDRNKRSTQDVASIALYEDSPNNFNKLKVSRRPATFELNKRRADTKRLQKDSGGRVHFSTDCAELR